MEFQGALRLRKLGANRALRVAQEVLIASAGRSGSSDCAGAVHVAEVVGAAGVGCSGSSDCAGAVHVAEVVGAAVLVSRDLGTYLIRLQ